MTVIVQILDDSGSVEGTVEIPEIDVEGFRYQLPDGWSVEILDGLESEDEKHDPGCAICPMVQVPSEIGVILVRECQL